MSCEGFYGKQAIPFPQQDPYIIVDVKPLSHTGSIAISVFRFEDRHIFVDDPYSGFLVCTYSLVQLGKCNETQRGKFFIQDPTATTVGPVLNENVEWNNTPRNINDTVVAAPISFKYEIPSNGFFCVAVNQPFNTFSDYDTSMWIQNPYGHLPAIFFPALPFFATGFAVYSLLFFWWVLVSFINRKELLPIQNLIGGLLFFLVCENAFNVGFFADFNNHGYISRPLLGVMVTLNAARNSISFFLLLVVSLGYGVVYPTLGKAMKWCILLAVVHFICDAVYLTYSMVTPDENSLIVFLFGVPLSISLFIFYIWIIHGLNQTIEYLESKRQSVKLQMYNRLLNILTASICILFACVVINSVNMSYRRDPSWIANQWKWRWLLLEGSLNINYFITFVAIAYLWMPTSRNARLSLMQLDSEDMEDQDGQGHFDQPVELFSKPADDEDDDVLQWAEDNVNDDETMQSISLGGVEEDGAQMSTTLATDKLISEADLAEIEELN